MNPPLPIAPDHGWFCPLLGRMIEDGRCLDINYQRLGYFKPDVLDEVRRETRKAVDEVSGVCEQCSNQQL